MNSHEKSRICHQVGDISISFAGRGVFWDVESQQSTKARDKRQAERGDCLVISDGCIAAAQEQRISQIETMTLIRIFCHGFMFRGSEIDQLHPVRRV